MSLIMKGIQAIKFLGGTGGTWYCRVKGCKMVATVDELKRIDDVGELPWAKLGKGDCASITPLCPIHGVLLDFNTSTELVKAFIDEDKKQQLALPMPSLQGSTRLHPHHPLENFCSL
jgi:hypothetical protein